MDSIGTRLKKIRLEKGLTIEEVHKKTKIHLNVLKAIEEDSLVNLSPVYVKGFLNIYCKFLEVDPKEYIPDYREVRDRSEVVTSRDEPEPRDEGIFIKGVAEKRPAFKPVMSAVLLKRIAAVVLILVMLFAAYKVLRWTVSGVAWLFRKRPQATAQQNPAVRTFKREPVVKKQRQPRKAAVVLDRVAVAPAISAPLRSVPSDEKTGGIRLSILTRDDCWVTLKLDGKVVFHGILKKGRTESWQAQERAELSLSNAGVVNLEVNGKLITNLGRRGQALKGIVITKDGLTVG